MLLNATDTKTQNLSTDNKLKKSPRDIHLGAGLVFDFKNQGSIKPFKEIANSYSDTSVAKGNINLAISGDVKKRIAEEAGRLGKEVINQADAILVPILDSLEKGKLSEYKRIKLEAMSQELINIKQTGTLWVAGSIAVNNRSISLNITPDKISSYGKMVFKNLNLLPSELKANVSCDFSKGSCSTEIYDLQTKETLLKL